MLNAFKTQVEVKRHVQGIIQRIDICSSLKTKYPEDYRFFLELFENHPKYPQKLANMTDITITRNKRFGNPELSLVRNNNPSDTDNISWNDCIYGRSKNNLLVALRVAIEPQITEFRRAHPPVCQLCKNHANHVDHINYFEQLVCVFLGKWNEQDIPTVFGEYNDGSNRKCFCEKDKDFQVKWEKSHLENAQLRILCEKCNLTRAKWDGKIEHPYQ